MMTIPDIPLKVWHDNLVDLCARFMGQQPAYRAQVMEEAQACYMEPRFEAYIGELTEIAKMVIKAALADCRERVLAPAFDATLDATSRVHRLLTQIERYYMTPMDLAVVGCLIPVLRRLEGDYLSDLCQIHFKLWVDALQSTLAPLPVNDPTTVVYSSLALLQGMRMVQSAVWDGRDLLKPTCSQLRKWWLLEKPVNAGVLL